MSDDKEQTIWELLETPPELAKHTAALYRWSLNYDQNAQVPPYWVFLDLIGFSAEHFGGIMVKNCELDHISADYVADALKEYAVRPNDISEFCEKLHNAESE